MARSDDSGILVVNHQEETTLAKFCHELRNALHVIRGYTEILRDDPATVGVKDILDRLGVASDTALGLAEKYLDLARLDTPDVVVRPGRVPSTLH